MDIEREMGQVRFRLEMAERDRFGPDDDGTLENRCANLGLELNAIPIAGHLEPAVVQAIHEAVAVHVQAVASDCMLEVLEKVAAAQKEALGRRIGRIERKITWLLWIVIGIGPVSLLF